MKEVTVLDLQQKINQNEKFQLIDIREDWEVERFSIGGLHIPMGELLENLDRLKLDRPVIIHCQSGKRSSKMVQYLEKYNNKKNVYSLAGGIEDWVKKIEKTLKVD